MSTLAMTLGLMLLSLALADTSLHHHHHRASGHLALGKFGFEGPGRRLFYGGFGHGAHGYEGLGHKTFSHGGHGQGAPIHVGFGQGGHGHVVFGHEGHDHRGLGYGGRGHQGLLRPAPLHQAPAHYAYNYGVQDDYTGSTFGHTEVRDGHKTEGRYFVHLPDGRLQTVTYYADEYGFHPVVSYEGVSRLHGAYH